MTTAESTAKAKPLETLVMVLTILLVFIMAARTPLEPDLGWHLRAGQTTLETGTPLTVDLFSYTRYGEKWVNHSWLGQVLFYLMYRWAGYAGVGALVAVAATASMALVYGSMEGPGLLRAFLVVLASLIAAWVWSARPQVLSLTLLAGLAYVLYLYKWRQIDRLWILLPLFILWSNLHGGYVLGFMLLAAALGGEVLNHALGYRDDAVLPWKKIIRLGLWSLGAGLAVLINPNGMDTWLIPFQTVGVNALQAFISEWASADFHDFAQQPLLWMVFALLAAVGSSDRRLDGADLLALVIFGYSAFVARRNFGPFAIISAPVLSRHVWPAVQAWLNRSPQVSAWLERLNRNPSRQVSKNFSRVVNLTLAGLIGLAAFGKLAAVTYAPLVESYRRAGAEAGATAWIADNQPRGRIFNSYNWGGYLIWELPEYPVFVDGRTDLFGDEIIGEWMDIVQAGEGWQAKLDQWQINLVLLEPDRPVVVHLAEAGWQLLYADEGAVVYGR